MNIGITNRCIHGLLLAFWASTLLGCVNHIAPYEPKIRKYKIGKYAALSDRRSPGALWTASADTLFTYRRASRVGDLITILISESANATRGAGTELSRKSELGLGLKGMFGLVDLIKKANPAIDPSKLLSAMSDSSFSGKGTTQRSGTLNAKLTARIKRVMPNGDLYVEGHKVVLVNDEESHVYLSGVVRPSDVLANNTVESAHVTDLQVEYTGRGAVTGAQKPGWLTRFFNWINPF